MSSIFTTKFECLLRCVCPMLGSISFIKILRFLQCSIVTFTLIFFFVSSAYLYERQLKNQQIIQLERKKAEQSKLAMINFEDAYEDVFNVSDHVFPGSPETAEELFQRTNASVEMHSWIIANASSNFCGNESRHLTGKIAVVHPHNVIHITQDMKRLWRDIEAENSDVSSGGLWQPKDCIPSQRVAIVLPYRSRAKHLALLLRILHSMLKRQMVNYQIFVVEQFGNEIFNKALLLNVAFNTISQDFNNSFDCFVFHDVDMLPENDRNIYECSEFPMHLSPAVDKMKYRLPYHELVGGVFAIRPIHFRQVNGYSNLYWGWGGEDDDLYYRLEKENIPVMRPSINIGRYKMMLHHQRQILTDKIRYKLVWSAKLRYQFDGLRQLVNVSYEIVSVNAQPLYTNITVDIGKAPSYKRLRVLLEADQKTRNKTS